jgi:hemin uptake protein HemP
MHGIFEAASETGDPGEMRAAGCSADLLRLALHCELPPDCPLEALLDCGVLRMSTAACSSESGKSMDPPRYDARALTGGLGVACIELDGQVYTLRITRLGKLILTK